MPGDLSALLMIFLVALVTFGSRIGGTLIMSRIGTTPRISRFLDALAVSVVAALVASIAARGGLREIAAITLASVVMIGARSATWAMLTGMLCAAAWTALVS